jgi:SNF2 family DNA or RNA helicase
LIRIRNEAPDDKMIVVSQFTSFLNVIQPLLTQEGFSFVRLDGSMSQGDRKETIDVFHSTGPNSPNVMLLSLKAGGVGLNLTSANHLLLLDPAWNPAVEWQCFDRIHRMGQTKDVFIYKFITIEDSIEETMLEIQARKEDIISGAFHMPDDERRRQRINDILTIFNLNPQAQPAGGGAGANQQLGGAPAGL